MSSRRTFLRTATAAAGVAALSSRFTARSYGQIAGSNERVNFAVIGLNSRAYAHLSSLQANTANARITQVCDVDTVILEKYAGATEKVTSARPKTQQDFRHVLESKDVDVITIATPDHWHAPMAILGLEAGKHVYVESPVRTTRRKANFLSLRRRNTASYARWGRSSGHHRTPSRSSTRSITA